MKPMDKGQRRVDRILEPSYLEGLSGLDEEGLRSLRDECEEEETVLSYERRLIHARLDIIRAELDRRSSGASARSLIDRLPEILTGGDEQPTHRGSFPKLAPPPLYETPRRRIELLVNDDTLARLPDLTEDEIGTILSTLESAEGEVSESRKAVLAVLDRVIEELSRRFVPHT